MIAIPDLEWSVTITKAKRKYEQIEALVMSLFSLLDEGEAKQVAHKLVGWLEYK
ncbi:YueH family protein [Staphylococcus marylandisciuri]|uniref:YueH family protein n=1 Tax=Staphylococcus marylandisciuri TaxID=2981529 RepID=UPI0021CEF107|nr:YueH family protein [Staphylococcus marylandisciuri]